MHDISFLTDHYDAGIARVNAIGAPLNFVFITDMHSRMNEYAVAQKILPGPDFEYAVDHVRSIQYILDRCPGIQCVICGGDTGNDYDEDMEKFRFSHQEIGDALHSLSVPAYCIIGNHDIGIGTALGKGLAPHTHGCLPDELHRIFQRNIDASVNYFYVDFPGYRFAFLDTSDQVALKDENGDYPFIWNLQVTEKQLNWFVNEACATDSRIIVFSHNPIHNAGMVGSDGAVLIKPYDDMLNAPKLRHLIKSNPKVIANIAGHVHYDNIAYDDSFLTITTLCSLPQEWTASCPRREYGTVTETAFDVFSIKDNVIYMTRFGAGADRVAAIRRGK